MQITIANSSDNNWVSIRYVILLFIINQIMLP